MVTEILRAVTSLTAAGERAVLATELSAGTSAAMSLLRGDGSVEVGAAVPPAVTAVVTEVLRSGSPDVVAVGETAWFVEPVLPPPRLIVLGAIAVADALVPMAAAAGFSVVVVDSREWLADPDRHPTAAEVHRGEPAEVLSRLPVDGSTAIVSFLHEPRLEDPVMHLALTGPAAYVGSMGSRRTTEAKRARLAEQGLTAEQVARLRAPIGLPIGSVTPAEIAVAVLAEIVAVSRGAA